MKLGWQLSPDGLGLEIDLMRDRFTIDRITIPLSIFQKEQDPVQIQSESPVQDTALGDGVQPEVPTSGGGDVEPAL